MKHPSMHHSRLAAALMFGAAAGLCPCPRPRQVTDLSQTPLASASNLTVQPNLLFMLDDSGCMIVRCRARQRRAPARAARSALLA